MIEKPEREGKRSTFNFNPSIYKVLSTLKRFYSGLGNQRSPNYYFCVIKDVDIRVAMGDGYLVILFKPDVNFWVRILKFPSNSL